MTTPLHLTPEQAAIAESLKAPGFVLLERITRETFDGSNVKTSGAYVLELGAAKEAALPLMREAIALANNPPAPTRRPRKAAAGLCPPAAAASDSRHAPQRATVSNAPADPVS
jgi:hypothetical protein